MSRLDALKKLSASVDKQHGAGTMAVGVRHMDIPRLETGSLSLDISLGGGIPIGRTTIFYGDKSSGKTTTAYRTAGNAQGLCAHCLRKVETTVVEEENEATGEVTWHQEGHCDCYQRGLFVPRQYPEEKKDEYAARVRGYVENSYEEYRVALFDYEGAYDKRWAAQLGLDDRLIVYVRPDTAEEGIDIYDSLMRTGAVDLFILDSLAAMTPSKEVEESVEKWQQGLQARLLNKFCRKTQSSVNSVGRDFGRVPTQLWINQLRMKIGVMFGNPETMPGGMGQGFVSSCEIKLWSNGYDIQEVESIGGDDKDLQVAKSVRINFSVEKNKTAPPKGKGSYSMELESGKVDQLNLYVSLCERYGELSKDGAKWTLGMQTFTSKKAAIEAMQEAREWARLTAFLRKKMIA
jgi:recombination protein RecA